MSLGGIPNSGITGSRNVAYLWPWRWWDGIITSPQAGPKVCPQCHPQNPLVPEEVLSQAPDGLWGQVQQQGRSVEGSEGGGCGNGRDGARPPVPEARNPAPGAWEGHFLSQTAFLLWDELPPIPENPPQSLRGEQSPPGSCKKKWRTLVPQLFLPSLLRVLW